MDEFLTLTHGFCLDKSSPGSGPDCSTLTVCVDAAEGGGQSGGRGDIERVSSADTL
ncbi:hypothetical protein JOB18_010923 [Solea senegalensis]|uniref:Uncharacterized protein n=1 Tax=Solea senegalensis TaxID=28829 RepID=A0AAV6QFU6_SOLSE|nr:hypothetical protein JOB18_010923 [Solea senegalensis]